MAKPPPLPDTQVAGSNPGSPKKPPSAKETVIGLAVLGVIGLAAFNYINSDSSDREVVSLAVWLDDVPTLLDYTKIPIQARSDLLAAYMDSISADPNDADQFRNCMGDYAVTKSPSLATAEVLGWCEHERLNIPARFAAHYGELDAEDLSIYAYSICKELAGPNLLSPAGADFPWLPDVARRRPGQSYWISTAFDAPNAFGVMLRGQLHCDLRHDLTGSPADVSSWNVTAVEVTSN